MGMGSTMMNPMMGMPGNLMMGIPTWIPEISRPSMGMPGMGMSGDENARYGYRNWNARYGHARQVGAALGSPAGSAIGGQNTPPPTQA
jgi:hypothetical protein